MFWTLRPALLVTLCGLFLGACATPTTNSSPLCLGQVPTSLMLYPVEPYPPPETATQDEVARWMHHHAWWGRDLAARLQDLDTWARGAQAACKDEG